MMVALGIIEAVERPLILKRGDIKSASVSCIEYLEPVISGIVIFI